VDLGDETFMHHGAYRARLKEYKALKSMNLQQPIQVEWTSLSEDYPDPQGSPAAQKNWQMLQESLPLELNKHEMSPQAKKRFTDPENLKNMKWEKQATQEHQEIPNNAPYSERGVLKFENMNPDQAVQTAQNLNLMQGLAEDVPYSSIYRGAHRRGRVIPTHEEYATGEQTVGIPAGHMIVHGMTGAKNAEQALERLDQLHETGGLKSIAERRRMGLGLLHTLSPKGDIASGLDTGVATRIQNQTVHKSMVFFGFKPQAIERRDVFFSDSDFGSGHDRTPSYEAYAKSIGQETTHATPSDKSRKTHLINGLGPKNEAFFKHEVPWDEIDTIWVRSGPQDEDGMLKATEERVQKWKAAGSMPQHIRVEGFTGSPDIAGRADALEEESEAQNHQ
jgi:hypothetical protein